MAKLEADVKRDMIKRIKEEDGYGRRFEDQYAVGIPDTILIPRGGRVFFCEVKLIKLANEFGVTPRQLEELQRVEKAGLLFHAIPCMVGYGRNTKRLYISAPALKANVNEMKFCEYPWDLSKLLNDYGSAIERAAEIMDSRSFPAAASIREEKI